MRERENNDDLSVPTICLGTDVMGLVTNLEKFHSKYNFSGGSLRSEKETIENL